jgi:hypothetical protein
MVMGKAPQGLQSFVGVDVSERRMDVHVLPHGEQAGFGRDRLGIAQLVAWLAGQTQPLVVVEATGGLQRGLEAALVEKVPGTIPWCRARAASTASTSATA